MSGKKQPSEKERRKHEEEVVADTAAVFTCLQMIANDFAYQCGDESENVEADIAFNKVALEMWSERTGRAQDLVAALVALADARERHRQMLIETRNRFIAIADDESTHEVHLGPPEAYRDLIRKRLFPEPPTTE